MSLSKYLFPFIILLPFFVKAQSTTVATSSPVFIVRRLEVANDSLFLVCKNDSVFILNREGRAVFSKRGIDGRISLNGKIVSVLNENGNQIDIAFYGIDNGQLINKLSTESIRAHTFDNSSEHYYYILGSGQIIKVHLMSLRQLQINTLINPENITSISETAITKNVVVGADIQGEFIDSLGQHIGYYETPHMGYIKTHRVKDIILILNLGSDFSYITVIENKDTTKIEKVYSRRYKQKEMLGDIELVTKTNYSMIYGYDISPGGDYIITSDQTRNLNYWTKDGKLVSSFKIKNTNSIVRFANENTIVYYDNGLKFLKLKE